MTVGLAPLGGRGSVGVAFGVEGIFSHVDYISAPHRFFIPEIVGVHLAQNVIELAVFVDGAQVVDAFLRKDMGAMRNHLAFLLTVAGQRIQALDGTLDPGGIVSGG